jgi:hypothetical protein
MYSSLNPSIVHVRPASVVFQSPSPCEVLPRMSVSPPPDVHDVGVGRVDGDGADGAAEVAVGRRRPVHAAVGGLPDAAAGGAHPVLERALDAAGGRHGAAAARGPDLAPAERGEGGVSKRTGWPATKRAAGSGAGAASRGRAGRLGRERAGEDEGAEQGAADGKADHAGDLQMVSADRATVRPASDTRKGAAKR